MVDDPILKTVDDIDDLLKRVNDLKPYDYQAELTPKLDDLDTPFTQEIINEIVLWKVNRYAKMSESALSWVNKIETSATVLDEQKTREVLRALLRIKGIRLPMASTILRFRNPNIYQIIDQRVYRVIFGEKLKSFTPYKLEEDGSKLVPKMEKDIDLYLHYLEALKAVCEQYGIEFNQADRILYSLDQEVNKDIKISY